MKIAFLRLHSFYRFISILHEQVRYFSVYHLGSPASMDPVDSRFVTNKKLGQFKLWNLRAEMIQVKAYLKSPSLQSGELRGK